MRILVYLPADREGGGIVNFLQLVKAVALAFPHDHLILAIPEAFPLSKWTFPSNMEIVPLPTHRVREWGRLEMGLFGLKRLAAAHRADAVWALNLGAYRTLSAPQILTVNNPYQVCPWPETKWHPSGVATRAMIRFFFRRSLEVSAGVVAQTEIMKRRIESLCDRGQRLAVVPKAVEHADSEKPELSEKLKSILESGLGRSAFTFLYVATGVPHKNHGVLLRAMDALRNEGVSARLVLTLTPEQILAVAGESLRGSVAGLIESGHVVAAGWIDSRHLRPLYEACDACVMPSVMESLSSSHLEAMDWGRPQVTADLPYARDLCGDAALYAPPDDAAAWAEAMRRIMNEPALRGTLVAAGHRRMLDFPRDWGEAARRVRAFIAEIAGVERSMETNEMAASTAV